MTTRGRRLDAVVEPLKDSYGNLERRYAADVLFVPPHVRLEGDRLVWRFGGKARSLNECTEALFKPFSQNPGTVFEAVRSQWSGKRAPPGEGLLRAFVELADAPPERIRNFARRAGVMGFCTAHGLPCSHPRIGEEVCEPAGWDGAGGWEPLDRWRFFARRARSLLLVASRLRKGDYRRSGEEMRGLAGYNSARNLPTKQEAWASWDAMAAAVNELISAEHEPADTWELVTVVVNDWLYLGNVRPWLLLGTSRDERPRLVLSPAWGGTSAPEFPLFGVLGMQLALAVPTERGLEFCSACGKSFEPGRQPRKGVRHYCPECGRPAMQRVASRAYRERKSLKAPAKGARASRSRR